ncbi:MAG: hypothetical protein SFW66_09660 [Gammaproteobacteria bacterium]|nr:hypothetical protein [Gammaproteobacteria bacterium]
MGYFTTLETFIDTITSPDSASEEKLATRPIVFTAYQDKSILEPIQHNDSFIICHQIKNYRPQNNFNNSGPIIQNGITEHMLTFAKNTWVHQVGMMKSYRALGSKLIVDPSTSWRDAHIYFWPNLFEKDIHVHFRHYTTDEINAVLDAFIAYPGKRKCVLQIDQPLAINKAFVEKILLLRNKKRMEIKLSPLNNALIHELQGLIMENQQLSYDLQQTSLSLHSAERAGTAIGDRLETLQHETEVEQKSYEYKVDALKITLSKKEQTIQELAKLLEEKEKASSVLIRQLARVSADNHALSDEINAYRTEKYFREMLPELLEELENDKANPVFQREYERNLNFVYQSKIDHYLANIDAAPPMIKDEFEEIYLDLAAKIEYIDNDFFLKSSIDVLEALHEDSNAYRNELEIITQEFNTDSVRNKCLSREMKNEAILMILRDRKARDRTQLETRLADFIQIQKNKAHGGIKTYFFAPNNSQENISFKEYRPNVVRVSAS